MKDRSRTRRAFGRRVRRWVIWTGSLVAILLTARAVFLALYFFKVFDILGWTPLGALHRAERHLSAGEFEQAIAACNRALAMDPEFLPSYEQRGEVYEAQGDYARAITDYTRLIRVEPRSAGGYMLRGRAYEKMGDVNRATADYVAAALLHPDSPFAPESDAWTRSQTGDTEAALEEMIVFFDEAVRRDPDNSDLRFCLFRFQSAMAEFIEQERYKNPVK